ncbi:Hypothetical protein I5071_8610 [Sandaracinus amylolyticus]|nr:Hypothetical protein I5071_8610 [Sandaracinus amylolyticus]
MQSRTRRRRRGPQHGVASIAELMPRVYPSNEPDELRLVRTIAWWDRHVPPRVSRNARPTKLYRGTLMIHAVTSAWSQEISMLLPGWMQALARAVPGIDPTKVRVKVGPLPPKPPSKPVPPPIAPLALTDLPDQVAASLITIADDQVRDAVARAAAQSLAPRTPRAPTRRTGR